MKKIEILVIIMLCVCCGCTNTHTTTKTVNMISINDVFKMIEDDSVAIIDVREKTEYTSGHIQNAKNVPVDKISKSLLDEIPLSTKVVVYCKSGARSKIASEKILELGYTNVYNAGGIQDWKYDLITD